MHNKEKIKKLVEETLDVSKNIQAVEPNPFLLSKIMNQIEQGDEGKRRIQPIYVPMLRAAAIALLLAANTFILFNNQKSNGQEVQISSNTIDLIMEDYNLNIENSSIYN